MLRLLSKCNVTIRYAKHLRKYSFYSTLNVKTREYLCKHLDIHMEKAENLTCKYPSVNNLDENRLLNLINTVQDVGLSKSIFTEEPALLSILPVTLKFRYLILSECGFKNVGSFHLVSYLKLMKQATVGDLKKSGIIPSYLNVENRLASNLTQWPTSLTTSICGDIEKYTLHSLRLKIIQQYLEIVLDLTYEEFEKNLKTYPTIKHRPLQTINENLSLLQLHLKIPTNKIKSNFFLIHMNPDNLKMIIGNLRTICGNDIKEVIRIYPLIATRNYSNLIEIRKILNDYGISEDAQRRCPEIYTLGPDTVKRRLEMAKLTPEFRVFMNHPRFLKMIYYKTRVMNRLNDMHTNKERSISLNILTVSSEKRFKTYKKSLGDQRCRMKDLKFCLSHLLGHTCDLKKLEKILKRHPFLENVSLVQVEAVYKKLSMEFSVTDIYENCCILLYPLSKIKHSLELFESTDKNELNKVLRQPLDRSKITKSQILSLTLYILEKDHHFSGNGVWTD